MDELWLFELEMLGDGRIVDGVDGWMLIFGWECDRCDDCDERDRLLKMSKLFEKHGSHPECGCRKMQQSWELNEDEDMNKQMKIEKWGRKSSYLMKNVMDVLWKLNVKKLLIELIVFLLKKSSKHGWCWELMISSSLNDFEIWEHLWSMYMREAVSTEWISEWMICADHRAHRHLYTHTVGERREKRYRCESDGPIGYDSLPFRSSIN